MNLYKETIEVLTENGKTFDDVVAICGKEFQITKDDFLKYSDVEYEEGDLYVEVAEDLMVVGNDFWLERREYDGNEWWEFKTMPKYKEMPLKKITALTGRQAQTNGVDLWYGMVPILSIFNPNAEGCE